MAGQLLFNSAQKQSIEHVDGPMLVLAGAGTGKTTVLVERIAQLIEQGHAKAEEILAITFTENAATELKERVEKRLRRKAPIWAGTFNACCHSILQRHGHGFFVLPPEDVYVFLRQRVEQLGLKRFIRPSDLGQFLGDLRDFFDRCHEELITPQQFQEYVDSLKTGNAIPRNCKAKDIEKLGAEEILHRWQEIARVYSRSMDLLVQEGFGTFGMQISGAVRLLQAKANLLEQERQKARFILIDEFQDCNSSNIILAELLAGEAQNIFAVGDPDQAIYRFRGASSAAFVEFQKRFPRTQGVVLSENQRSRGNILKVAYAVIRQNPPVPSLGDAVRFERVPLQSGRDLRDQESGRFVFDEPVELVISKTHGAEAAMVAEEIQKLRQILPPQERSGMAVLYRQHAHREKVMEELAGRGIPFIVRGMDVLETALARDLLAIARATKNENDAESLFRVCAHPPFGLSGPELRQKLSAAGQNSTFKSILGTFEDGSAVLAAVRKGREPRQKEHSAAAALTALVREFHLPKDDPVIQAVLRFAANWERKPFFKGTSLDDFLDYLELYRQAGGIIPMFAEEQIEELEREYPDAVQLMTIHAAKGLEFSHVWLLRVTTQSFPTMYREPLFEFPPALRSSTAAGDGKEIHDQEERRLFYVAITRARDRLAIGSRPGKSRDKAPSGFLRPLMLDRDLREATASQEIQHAPLAAAQEEVSVISSWMLLPPAFKTDAALSANAVQSYSVCPMKFKLERDWKLPGGAAAALHYGNAIHTALRQYYDPAPREQAVTVENVLRAFHTQFSRAVIEDPVQKQMYAV
ncbi:MAG TPA: ATP-dependent helicase [Candidatus Angelobacter sp.]|nr:ATP-dependent helicase [Candidatus Angelobacter sp.]